MTVQLADKSPTETAAISLPAANAAVDAASRYWKTMSNNRLSLSVASTRTGVKTAATSNQSYSQIMDTVTRELNWVTNPYTALVVFIATPTLSSNAYGAGWSTSGISGRVLMPLPGSLTDSVLTHEFGHVLGLMHSDSLQCLSGASDVASTPGGSFADSSCTIREYGNTMDLMGVSQRSQPTISSSLWQYGGFGRGDEILDAGKIVDSKSFTLTAWAGTASKRAVKFTDPMSGEAYYLELRLPVGYDTATAIGGNRGVNIVQNGGSTAASSIILMPSTKPFSSSYGQNHAWQAGQTFTTHAGTRVSIDWISDSAAGVTIESIAAVASRAMAAVASATASLGSTASGVVCGLRGGGCYQDYQGGAIIWSPATGAQPTTGAIRARWGALNFVDGPMGYPTSAETCGQPAGGCYQNYQGGAIIWSPTTGAHASTGTTRTAWAKSGFLDGPLRYPTGDVTCGMAQGGCYQDYEGGAIIWSPATGAHATTGPTRAAWARTGFLDGPLGYPTSDVICGQP
ncbi:M43 family zinc metalloprotease, partial [Arthrobacter sp. ES1]